VQGFLLSACYDCFEFVTMFQEDAKLQAWTALWYHVTMLLAQRIAEGQVTAVLDDDLADELLVRSCCCCQGYSK
jgi:hypothetical protein